MADLRDRQYVSQFAADTLGLSIQTAAGPMDADGDVVVTLTNEDTGVEVFSRAATRVAIGMYEVTLSSQETDVPGPYMVRWSYSLSGTAQEYRTYIEIGEYNPDYDNLSPQMKDVVDTVWIRFADLFDSPTGGPNLMTYFQGNFGRGRLAQILKIGLGRLNTMAQPYMTYTLGGDGGAAFPVAKWGPLLETVTYVEAVRHLIRSYVEQPLFQGSGAVSRLDRRDYLERWQSVLQAEERMLQSQLEVFKMAHMGLGRPRVLVSGGVFGRYGPTRIAGSVAARPRYWTRFY